MTEIKHYELGELADVTKLAGFEFTKHIKYNNYGEIIALRALNLRHGELDLTDIITMPFFDMIFSNYKENQYLSSLRDTILPQLMSGELDVSNITL